MVNCGQDLNAPGRVPLANCSEHSSDATSFGEVKEFQPEWLINRELILLCLWALWHILLCHDTHEELYLYTCHANGLWPKLWSFCILWLTESRLNWMRKTVCSVSYVETLTRTNQSIACLFLVSFSLLFTPLTMNMRNVLLVRMQWRSSFYVVLLGGVMWCLDCTWHVCTNRTPLPLQTSAWGYTV